MSTVISNDTIALEGDSSHQPTSNKILKSAYEKVLDALKNNKKIIFISGESKRGKSALIHSICNNIAPSNRIIFINGKDLPLVDDSKKNTVDSELNKMKDFIFESTDLNDQLVVVLDDSNHLPIKFLQELLSHAKDYSFTDQKFQLILTGPPDLKDKLLALDKINKSDLFFCKLDDPNKEKILNFAENKIYKISSTIKNLKFESGSLNALSDYTQANKQILDVILEWCAALTKKDQLTSISADTVTRAISFAQQFSKDKNIRLTSAYPPSHEVYKFINDVESTKNLSIKTFGDIENYDASEAFIKKPLKTDSQKSKIPTITSKVEPNKKIIKSDNEKNISENKKASEFELDTLSSIEDEIMPTQWTPISKNSNDRKKPFSAFAGLLTTLVLGFVIFIAYKITDDPTIDDSSTTQISTQETEENITIEEQLAEESYSVLINEQVQETSESVKEELVTSSIQIEPEVVSIKKDTVVKSVIHTPKVAPLVLGEIDESILSEDAIELDNSEKVENLLALAKRQFQVKRMTTPAGDNAFETYQKILEIQSDNQQAVAGIKEVHDKYINWADYYLKRNDIERAKRFYNRALIVDPNDKVARINLEKIKDKQSAASNPDISVATINTLQDVPLPSKEIQNLLLSADEKLLQIQQGVNSNQRNYKDFQDAQIIYQKVLSSQPDNLKAKQGLSSLKEYFVDWAELQIQNRNYNIALFLYGQALSIEPDNIQLSQRIEQIRELKKSL